MKEDKKGSGKGWIGGVIFFAGFIPALILGWVVFPNVLFSQKPQPMNFSHVAHQDSTCEDCHALRPDGTYTGIPGLDKCIECHESPMGSTEDERILVEEYIQQNKPIPWKVYSWQPDNVYFSHAPHKGAEMQCTTCHRDVSQETTLPAYYENRLTGYSKETRYSKGTMQMVDCEKCHAERKVSNECELCHK
jgi:hypothetical protein